MPDLTLPAGYKPWDRSSDKAPADWAPGGNLFMDDGLIQPTSKGALISWGMKEPIGPFRRLIIGYEPAKSAPDLNRYLRLADVEGMIKGKIAALTEKIERSGRIIANAGETTSGATLIEHSNKIADAAARRSALGAALFGLRYCEQFDLREFKDFDGKAWPAPALVRTAADRVPVEVAQ